MNWLHRRLCSSPRWAETVEQQLLPWTLNDVALGSDVLEIGPGYGANLRVLIGQVPRLTSIEIDEALVESLRGRYGDRARIVHGDGAAMPFESPDFTAVLSFTMLHHVPSGTAQDRLFAEAFRVLRPGGVFAGCDSLPSLRFRLLHVGDTMVPLDPVALPGRLAEAGFSDISVTTNDAGSRVRFLARKPS